MHLKIIRGLKQEDILHHAVAGTLRAQPCRIIADIEQVQFSRNDKGEPFAEVIMRDGTPNNIRLDGVAVVMADNGDGIDLFDALVDPVIKLPGKTTAVQPAAPGARHQSPTEKLTHVRGVSQADHLDRAIAAVETAAAHKRGPKKKGATGRPPGRPRKNALPMVDPASPMGQALDRAMGAEIDPVSGNPQLDVPDEGTPPAPAGKGGEAAKTTS